jgi:hypothetical protein
MSTKTFFSPTMSRREVVMKIREALSNAVLDKNSIPGKLQAVGYTKDGIAIRFYVKEIDNTIQITSAFPCQNWLKI